MSSEFRAVISGSFGVLMLLSFDVFAAAEMLGIRHNIRKKEVRRCEYIVRQCQEKVQEQQQDLESEADKIMDGIKKSFRISEELYERGYTELTGFRKAVEAKEQKIAELKGKIQQLTERMFLLPHEQRKLCDLEEELELYGLGLEEMQDLNQARIAGLHGQLVILQRRSSDCSDEILAILDELRKLHEWPQERVQDAIDRHYQEKRSYNLRL